jgi:hypothetical protein
MTLKEKLRNPTLGEKRNDGGDVGHNRIRIRIANADPDPDLTVKT